LKEFVQVVENPEYWQDRRRFGNEVAVENRKSPKFEFRSKKRGLLTLPS
jgi:hypothetical protein